MPSLATKYQVYVNSMLDVHVVNGARRYAQMRFCVSALMTDVFHAYPVIKITAQIRWCVGDALVASRRAFSTRF